MEEKKNRRDKNVEEEVEGKKVKGVDGLVDDDEEEEEKLNGRGSIEKVHRE